MLRAIICIVVGLLIADRQGEQAAELRIENQDLRRDIEKLRIEQGQTLQGQA